MTPLPDPPKLEARIEVEPSGGVWIVRSSDNLFSGVFIDRRSACRHAVSEAEAHPGHVVVIRDGPRRQSEGSTPSL